MTTSRLLIIVVIVVVVLTIVSMVVGGFSHQKKNPPDQSRSAQSKDVRSKWPGSLLSSFAKSSSGLKQPFDLTQITILGKHPASRQITLNAKGQVEMEVSAVSGNSVRQLSLVRTSSEQSKITIDYEVVGTPPTGIDPKKDLPGRGDNPMPTLPNTDKDADPTRCDLPIYPCGAKITVTASATQGCTIEMR